MRLTLAPKRLQPASKKLQPASKRLQLVFKRLQLVFKRLRASLFETKICLPKAPSPLSRVYRPTYEAIS